MTTRTSYEVEMQVLALNGTCTQTEVSQKLNLSLPTIRNICKRNNVKWKWHVANQYGENNHQYINGMGRSTIERLTRRVLTEAGRCLYTCERCKTYNKWQEQTRHHKDRDRSNNAALNIEVLCNTCHMIEHQEDRVRDDITGRFVS